MGGPGYDRMRADLEAAAHARLDAAVAQLPAAVAATPTLLAGDPARELVEHSRELDLLVVGSRRYGPLRAVLLGGVSGRVVRSAACPVVVVPRGEERPLAALTARGVPHRVRLAR
jgi:nucleotide-binding universal stress UspA family protein